MLLLRLLDRLRSRLRSAPLIPPFQATLTLWHPEALWCGESRAMRRLRPRADRTARAAASATRMQRRIGACCPAGRRREHDVMLVIPHRARGDAAFRRIEIAVRQRHEQGRRAIWPGECGNHIEAHRPLRSTGNATTSRRSPLGRREKRDLRHSLDVTGE
jgi:hypothetical protein